jgi:16S rRNA processing protein RimM
MPALIALAFLFNATSEMNVDDYYKIGLIMKPHGLKGEVTLSLDEKSPVAFSSLETVFILGKDNRLVPYFIQSASVKGIKAYVKFEDVNDPETAIKISKRPIFLPKSLRPKSAKGEFYDDEILDFEVWDENHGLLGRVTSVIQTGANKLLEVDNNGKEILIPINSPLITSINKSKKKICVDLPEGFLDI